MIGNDIIDLSVAGVNSRWQEQRFLNKLFSQEEQQLILKDNYRYQNIWRLWSMKESAYKIYSRNLRASIFKPKFFSCEITSENTGIVSFDNFRVHTMTKIESNIIYTTAKIKETNQLSKYFELYQPSQTEKSKYLKRKAIQAFGRLKSVSDRDVSIEKNESGVPQFFINGISQDNFLTLTHHGNYGGFAISY